MTRSRWAYAALLVELLAACAGQVPGAPAPSVVTTAVTGHSSSTGAPTMVRTSSKGGVGKRRAEPLAPLVVGDPFEAAADPESLRQFCDENLAAARRRLEALVAAMDDPPSELRWEQTFEILDEAKFALNNAAQLASLLGVVHPSTAIRSEAGECERRAETLESELSSEPRLLRVLERAAVVLQSASSPAVTVERRRFIDETLKALARGGARLSAPDRTRLRELNAQLTETSQAFVAALSSPPAKFKLRAAELGGLPESFRRAHPPGPDGRTFIAIEPVEAGEFLSLASDRKVAREVYERLLNRGGVANVGRVDRLLALRLEKAKLLGFESWADYVTAGTMAGRADEVRRFLDRLERAIAPSVEREFSALQREFARLPSTRPHTPLTDADRSYLVERIKSKTLKVGSGEIAEFFEVDAVTEVLFSLSREFFGVTFSPATSPIWHSTVEAFDAERDGRPIGRVYLDLFARPDKVSMPAMFGVRDRRRAAVGGELLPISVLVATLPEAGKPVRHDQVAVYFHEFGHVLQHLLSENELAAHAGTSVPRDAVEAASQVFEEWAFARPVLARLARHRDSKAPAPARLLDAIVQGRRVGAALSMQRQLLLARIDLELHDARTMVDGTKLIEDLQSLHDVFAPVSGTHMQSSFGHLVGYDAAYYGYPWSYVLAREALTRFEGEGFLSPKVVEEFRREVLAPGASRDPLVSWRAFLGRAPSERAFAEFFHE